MVLIVAADGATLTGTLEFSVSATHKAPLRAPREWVHSKKHEL
jgi:hypothetical protein